MQDSNGRLTPGLNYFLELCFLGTSKNCISSISNTGLVSGDANTAGLKNTRGVAS